MSAGGGATGSLELVARLEPGDYPYRVAERHLGDGNRWQELVDENGATVVGRERNLPVGFRLYRARKSGAGLLTR